MKANNSNSSFDGLLEFIKQNRGFDFSGYKTTSLQRRFLQRMKTVGCESYDAYIDYLEVDPGEFTELFNTILINVTAFLRDNEAWEYVYNYVLPKIIQSKAEEEPIRIWSAGVASGEEAYSVAMLLAEHLGFDAFKQRVKIYATDMDEDALVKARAANYTLHELENIPDRLRDKYFEHNGDHFYFHKELRRTIIFGRHNIIEDAPISRVDLLLCRNLLMYLNSDTQTRVLSRLHFALRDQGFLFLGKAEMLLTHSNLFTPIDLKHRVFTKVTNANNHDHTLATVAQRSDGDAGSFVFILPKIRDTASDVNPTAQIAVDVKGALVLANAQANTLFGLSANDIGRPIQDLRLSYQPVELRSLIDQARESREPIGLKDVPWDSNDSNSRFFDIGVTALFSEKNKPIGVSLTFSDVSDKKHLQKMLEQTHQELETAMEELESTNEELVTTNEELQSTVEELETTNEELQATNEELETMNEELQATNEELETLNSELSMRGAEVNEANAYLNSILASLNASVVVVNRDTLVEVWNTKSEDLWGVRKDEVLGQSFFSLDIGLPVDRLKPIIRSVLNGDQDPVAFIMDAINRRGQPVRLRGTAAPLVQPEKGISGVILILEPETVHSETV